MQDTPYARFDGEDLILRDELAIDRTLLANERTLLAYLRSAVALVLAGVTILHFVRLGWFTAVGIACIPGGIVTGAVGVARYRNMNRAIMIVRRQSRISTRKAAGMEPAGGGVARAADAGSHT